MAIRYFTFADNHTTTYPLPRGGNLADYYIEVDLPFGQYNHREVFIQTFTTPFCPNPMQFAVEYPPSRFVKDHYPKGSLALILPKSGHEIVPQP